MRDDERSIKPQSHNSQSEHGNHGLLKAPPAFKLCVPPPKTAKDGGAKAATPKIFPRENSTHAHNHEIVMETSINHRYGAH